MRKLIPLARAFALLVATVCPLAAQDDPCTRRSVLVTVVDQQGNVVRGLTAANFEAQFRGKPVQIESAVFDTGPRRVVIVINARAGMLSELFNVSREVAADAVRQISLNSSLALVIFGSDVVGTIGLSTGNSAVAKRISDLQVPKDAASIGHSRTALFDALAAALGILSPARQGDVIFALTDGFDKRSKLRIAQIEEVLTSQNVRFFCVTPVIEEYRAKTPEEAERIQLIERLVTSTGGGRARLLPLHEHSTLFWFDEKDKERVLKPLGRLYAQMSMNYFLSVQLPLPPDKPREWDLQVVDPQGKKRGDLTVLYPRKLLPCSSIAAAPAAPGAPK